MPRILTSNLMTVALMSRPHILIIMEQARVATAFLRHQGTILLGKRPATAPTYADQWGAVSGYIESGETPVQAAIREVNEELDVTVADPVRVGDPMTVTSSTYNRQFTIHPVLFDVDTREVTPNEEFARVEWVSPTAIHHKDAVPRLWEGYQRVAPSVATIADDETHGAAYLSRRALEVLRDRAGTIAAQSSATSPEPLRTLGAELRAARPQMAVLLNRVNRVLATADTPATIERKACAELDRAFRVADDTVTTARRALNGADIMTLSWSGTVRDILTDAASAAIAVSEPGGEGIDLAEALSEHTPVTVFPEAATAHLIANRDIDAVLVGADTILPDGHVINKTGTHMLAMLATRADIPVYVAASTDKVAPEASFTATDTAPEAVYAGAKPLDVHAPVFEVTPAELITAYLTDRGQLDTVTSVAVAHRRRANAVSMDAS